MHMAFGFVLESYFSAFFLSITIEMPVINMEKLLWSEINARIRKRDYVQPYNTINNKTTAINDKKKHPLEQIAHRSLSRRKSLQPLERLASIDVDTTSNNDQKTFGMA